MGQPKVSNIYFYHKDEKMIFKNIFNDGKITNKIEDDKYVGYLIFNKKEDKILMKPILNRSQYEKYINESKPNIIAQYCIIFPRKNSVLYLDEFKRKYQSTENKIEELKYNLVDQIVSDSKLLRQMQKEDDMTDFIKDININRNGEKINISLLFKFYEGIFDLNESEVYKLIDYLDYLDNDKLLDILTYAVYKNISLANYYNKLAKLLGENYNFNLNDNPTELEKFNKLLIETKGNAGFYSHNKIEKYVTLDESQPIYKYELGVNNYLFFIVENMTAAAKYFFLDSNINIDEIFNTIFYWSNNNEILFWVLSEINKIPDFMFLLDSLQYNKVFFNSENLPIYNEPGTKEEFNLIYKKFSLLFLNKAVNSIKFLYENYNEFFNDMLLRDFDEQIENIYKTIYTNNNNYENVILLLEWFKEKYPEQLDGFHIIPLSIDGIAPMIITDLLILQCQNVDVINFLYNNYRSFLRHLENHFDYYLLRIFEFHINKSKLALLKWLKEKYPYLLKNFLLYGIGSDSYIGYMFTYINSYLDIEWIIDNYPEFLQKYSVKINRIINILIGKAKDNVSLQKDYLFLIDLSKKINNI